jgi:ATP-dependent helicase/DNAse subunit B
MEEQSEYTLPTGKKHLSYSEMLDFLQCPFRHFLKYVETKDTNINEHTIFGNAVHSTCEKVLMKEDVDYKLFFLENFRNKKKELTERKKDTDFKLLEEMEINGVELFSEILPFLQNHFGNFSVVSVEQDLYERITEIEEDVYFKGFIDLVIKTEDGRFHIIDWKTTKYGWHPNKRNDKYTHYQMVLYKEFYCRKLNLKREDFDIHFVLLKWKNKKKTPELVSITSGKKKIENALKSFTDVVKNIQKGVKIKIKANCEYCQYKDTERCGKKK